MIKIKVGRDLPNEELIDPTDMINSPDGTIFQQYTNGKPTKDYYVSCGPAEKSVIHIWHDDDTRQHRLSTDDKKSLKELLDHVKVKVIDATLEINLR